MILLLGGMILVSWDITRYWRGFSRVYIWRAIYTEYSSSAILPTIEGLKVRLRIGNDSV